MDRSRLPRSGHDRLDGGRGSFHVVIWVMSMVFLRSGWAAQPLSQVIAKFLSMSIRRQTPSRFGGPDPVKRAPPGPAGDTV